MSVLIKESLVKFLSDIESVEFHAGGKGIDISIHESPDSKLCADELEEIDNLFYEFFHHNAEGPTHTAFYNPGRIRFNSKNILKVVHEYDYDDSCDGWDSFDNFSGLEKILHTSLSQNIKKLEAINEKLDIDSITLDGYFANGGFGPFELKDKRNGIALKLTEEIEKALKSTLANFLEDAVNIHAADKTIIDEMEIYESEVSPSLSVIWQDSYQLEPVEDYP